MTSSEMTDVEAVLTRIEEELVEVLDLIKKLKAASRSRSTELKPLEEATEVAISEKDVEALPWRPFPSNPNDMSQGWILAEPLSKDDEQIARVKRALSARIEPGRHVFIGKYRISRSRDGRFLRKAAVSRDCNR